MNNKTRFHVSTRRALLKRTMLLSMLLIVFLSKTIPASASEPGEQSRQIFREVTETYTDRSYGFSIELARDFKLSSEQGDVLFFKSPDRAGTVIIRPRPGLSLSNVQAAMRNGFESKVITLTPIGAPMTLDVVGGQGMAMEVAGRLEGKEVRGTMAGIFGGDQQGYVVLVGSVKERWMGFENSALTMLNSFSVNPVERGYEYERWQQRLIGKGLVFVRGYGNYHVGGGVVSEYQFCRDGTYKQRSDTYDTYSGAWRRGSYSTTSKGKGTWQVQYRDRLPLLTMYSKNGSQNLPITDKEGYVFLGGAPYRFMQNTLCP